MKPEDLYVILVEPEYEINLGMIARVMKNFGFERLRLVNPKVEIGKESFKFAVRAGEILEKAEIFPTLEKAIEDLHVVAGTTAIWARSKLNLLRVAVYPWEFTSKIGSFKGRLGIVFGRESVGLRNEELKLCDLVVTIPASSEYPVLNVSMAVAIILYEVYKALEGLSDVRGPIKLAPRELREKLVEVFETIVTRGRLQKHRQRLALQAFRNLVGRAFISEKEAKVLLNVYYKLISSMLK